MHAIDYILSEKSDKTRTKIAYIIKDEEDDDSLISSALDCWKNDIDLTQYPLATQFSGASFFPESYHIKGLSNYTHKLDKQRYVFLECESESQAKAKIHDKTWVFVESAPWNVGHAKIRNPKIISMKLAPLLSKLDEDLRGQWIYEAKTCTPYDELTSWEQLFKYVETLGILFHDTKETPYGLYNRTNYESSDRISLYDIIRDLARYLQVPCLDSERVFTTTLGSYCQSYNANPLTAILKASNLLTLKIIGASVEPQDIAISQYVWDKSDAVLKPELSSSMRFSLAMSQIDKKSSYNKDTNEFILTTLPKALKLFCKE